MCRRRLGRDSARSKLVHSFNKYSTTLLSGVRSILLGRLMALLSDSSNWPKGVSWYLTMALVVSSCSEAVIDKRGSPSISATPSILGGGLSMGREASSSAS